MSNWLATFASHDSSGVLYENTIGVKMDASAGAELDASTLAHEIAVWLATEYRACLPNFLTLDTLTARKAPFPTTAEGVRAIGLAGTASSVAEFPREMCALLSWKTDHPGRSGRGHIALPVQRATAMLDGGGSSWNLGHAYFTGAVAAFLAKLDDGHDYADGGIGGGFLGDDGHLSHIVYSRKDNAGYDVKARIVRAQVRWVERRQTAP